MLATQLSARLGVLQTEVDVALEEMAQTRVVARLWRKDHTLWKPEPREIENRLGWLTVAEEMQKQVGPLREFAESVRGRLQSRRAAGHGREQSRPRGSALH